MRNKCETNANKWETKIVINNQNGNDNRMLSSLGLELLAIHDDEVEEGQLGKAASTLSKKMMTDRNMANPWRPRRLFHTVLFSW